jgi:lysophospholipase L1-like esterase
MASKKLTLITIIALSFLCFAASDYKVKNVLIIGDSISIGYTPFVEKALAPGIAIAHNPGNGGSTMRGTESIEKWLDNKQWDVILFNFGLHDMVYKDQDNKYDVQNGKVSVTLEDYRKNLEAIVSKLKETTATLIFVNTTMVPENAAGRKVGDPEIYNAVALEVMKNNGIAVVDLYTPSLTIHPQNSPPNNVHYTPEGYEQLANIIVKAIRKVL